MHSRRRLGHAHHVVVRHNFLRAVVGHGDDAAAIFHERRGGARHRDQRIHADVVGDAEAFARGVDELAFQFLSRSEGHAVHQHMQLAVALFELDKQAVDVGVIGHIAHEAFRARQGERSGPGLPVPDARSGR